MNKTTCNIGQHYTHNYTIHGDSINVCIIGMPTYQAIKLLLMYMYIHAYTLWRNSL